jgi:hypothetical protein
MVPATAETASHGYLYHVVYNEAFDKVYDYLIKTDKVSEAEQGNDVIKETYQKMAEQKLQQVALQSLQPLTKGFIKPCRQLSQIMAISCKTAQVKIRRECPHGQ